MNIEDENLDCLPKEELLKEIFRLRNGIRKHRDARDNDRCWENDIELANLLPEKIPPNRMNGSKEELLKNCSDYIDCQKEKDEKMVSNK